MSDKYRIYRVDPSPNQYKYMTTEEDTLYYKIQQLLPELKATEEWKNKPDEEIENYIIRLYKRRNVTFIRAYKENRAYDPTDPRDAEWSRFTYEEIIEMHKNGINVPDDCLKWAYAQAAGDINNVSELDEAKNTATENINNVTVYDSTNSTYKQDKETLQTYTIKAEEQEKFIKNSEEQLAKDTKEIETKKRTLETERQDAQIKMENYKNEFNSLDQKLKNGDTLSESEISKYNQLNTMLNNQNNELILKAGTLEEEIASLESEIINTNNNIESNQKLETKINNTTQIFLRNEKYNSKYIADAGLKYISSEFSGVVYSAFGGELSTYSNSINGELQMNVSQSEYTAIGANNINDESLELIDNIRKSGVETLTANTSLINDNKDTKTDEDNAENEEKAISEGDKKSEETNLKPESEEAKETEAEKSPEAEETQQVAETAAETAPEETQTEKQPEIKTIKQNEPADNRIAAKVPEEEPEIAKDEVTGENLINNTDDITNKESEPVEEKEPVKEPETITADSVTEKEELEADRAIASKYSDNKADNTEEVKLAQAIPDNNENEADETTIPKTPEQITKANEVQRKDMAKVFKETDTEPETKGITTDKDATLRNASFSDVETSITSSADELEVLRQKALKYNTAGIEAKNTTTSIGETDYVINADGGATISGQGGSLTRNNNVNETKEDLNKLAETREEAQSVNNDINAQLIALNSLSDRNMSSVTTTANMPVQPESSNNSNELNKITRNVNNSSVSEAEAFRQAENAEEVGKGVINNSASELEKNETKNEIGHSNELFVSEDIDDESYDEINAKTTEEIDTKQTTRYSDMAAPGIMEEEVASNNMATDGLTAKIAEQDMSNAISENIQSISEEILKVEATQILANNNAQDTLNTRSIEAAKSSILTYGEKVQQKDNNAEIKRKVLTAFEIKRRDELKKGIEKVSSSAKMKH